MPAEVKKETMLVNVIGAKCVGIEAVPVTVEVDIAGGIGIHLVGLGDVAVRESLLRILTALQAKGFHIPGKKIVINLAPADIHKSGSGYDLPIALGIIAASGQRDLARLDRFLVMGELGLDGSVRPVPGALPMVELAVRKGLEGCILPADSALEAVDYAPEQTWSVRTLEDVLRILDEGDGGADLRVDSQTSLAGPRPAPLPSYMDFSEIIGQEGAKRGLEIACAGGHNVIMIGTPGSGKSSLARALAGILPPMTREESVQTSKVYSVAGRGRLRSGLMRERPFRAPHYSASLAAIVGGGGGENVQPGEISLAQNGILFLDEYGQAPASVLEALRGPLEDRKVVISRLRSKVEFPASFMLVAASNPCPCGYYGEGDRCRCTPGRRAAYLARLRGPLIDRIDIQLYVHSLPAARLVGRGSRKGAQESSAEVAARVARAREIQRRRFEGEGIFTNAEMGSRQMNRFCPLSASCNETLESVVDRFGLSARACSRMVKIARTIADLEGREDIRPEHLLEASAYRFLDRRDVLDF